MEELNNPAPAPEGNAVAPEAPEQQPAPVDETIKSATPDDQAAPTENEQPAEETEADKAARKQRFSERFSAVTAARKQAEQEATHWRSIAAEQQAKIDELSRINTDDLSWEQQQDVRTLQLLEKQQQATTARELQIREAAVLRARNAAFETKVDAAKDALPGFNLDEFYRSTPLTPYAAEVLIDLDNAPHVAHHLAQNPATAYRIAGLPPHKQGYEIAMLGMSVKAPSPARKVSNAPPPPSQLSGGASPGQKSAGDMSVSEIQAMFRKSGTI